MAPPNQAPAHMHPEAAPSVAEPAIVAPPASVPTQYVLIGTTLAFAVAVFVRFYGLGNIPDMLGPTEEVFRQAALEVARGGWIGLWSELTAGQPAGLAYWMAGWVAMLGDGAIAVRLPVAALGLATVGMLYLFCRSLFGARAAVLASLLLAVSVWHLHHSRLALPASPLPLIELGAVYLLLRGLGTTGPGDSWRTPLVLAGIVFGAGFYFHNAYLVFVVAVLLLWVREFLAAEHTLGELSLRAASFFVPALMVALPYLGLLSLGDEGGAGRLKNDSLFESAQYQELSGVTEQSRHVLSDVGNAALTLLWRSAPKGDDDEQQVSRRLLDPATALLALAGLAICLRRWRDRRYVLLWVLVGAALLGAGFSQKTSLAAVLVVALPGVFAAAGLALDALLQWMEGRVQQVGRYAFAGTLIGLVTVYNLASYYGSPLGPEQGL